MASEQNTSATSGPVVSDEPMPKDSTTPDSVVQSGVSCHHVAHTPRGGGPPNFCVGAAGQSTRSNSSVVVGDAEDARSEVPMAAAELLSWLEKMLFSNPRGPVGLGGTLQTSELNSALLQRLAAVVQASYKVR